MQNPYCCNPIYFLSSRWNSRRGSQFFQSLAQERILLPKSWERLPLFTACFACISFTNQNSALGSEFLSVHCKQQQGYCVLRLFWGCPGIWPLLLIKILGMFYRINLQWGNHLGYLRENLCLMWTSSPWTTWTILSSQSGKGFSQCLAYQVRTALSTLIHEKEWPYLQVSHVRVIWLAESNSCTKIVFGNI